METKSFIDLIKASRALSLLAFVVASFFLCVWTLFPEGWREFAAESMKANTAVGLMASASALYLKSFYAKEKTRVLRALILFLGLFVLSLGAATLLEYLLGYSFGIDQVLVADFLNGETALYPGRMSPIAALGITLTGICLLLLLSAKPFAVMVHQIFSLALMLISIFVLVGYLMGVDAFYKVGPFIRISYFTAACLLLLSVSGLFLRSQFGIMHLITGRTPGGMAIRRLLPAAIFLPPVIGWLRQHGEKAGYYGFSEGTSFSAITYIVLFSFLIYRSGRALNLAYAEKQKTEKKFLEELEYHTLQLEKAIHARDEFLSVASHELKTPLTSLKLQVQMQKRKMIRQSGGDPGNEKAGQFFEIAERQVNRLARLVEDMLDIGRIESGRFRLNLEEFDLVDLVKEVAEQMAGEVEAAGSELELNLSAKILIRADKVRLAQVLMNLLSNSCKYGGGKKIEVTAYEEPATDKVLLEVKDHGEGIALTDQERIFQRYERAVPGTHISGLGLGLFIVRKIMEQHKGKVSVQSTVGQGAKFILEIPRELHDTIVSEAAIPIAPKIHS
ncbi:MAG: ATP-binding protein [Bdellovibrionota bacterium]